MDVSNNALREQIVNSCKNMNASGLNQGTAGNISVRQDNGMLITPSGIAYDQMEIDDLVFVDDNGDFDESKIPSSEWRFHLACYHTRKDINAVVHNHAMYSTIVSILNKPIPAIHYMIGAAGGNSIPVVDYATYGTPELSKLVSEGVKNSKAILLRHHGMIATGDSLDKAMWLAVEVEALAQMYVNLLQITATPDCLPDEEIAVVLKKFVNYGLREK
ncbi:L-fuculose-phosphate aldolase [uncultured Cohaesibacter sp.]|uniref:L-fuculose-phosphate aldolase n=1 Tax=uncultured Cohaesibacter sp. TaxID=1002546 RepID=UPI002A0A7C0B|nr:L-fuculose-phosphate aldolase [uncultured Cohaesibacter sp.]